MLQLIRRNPGISRIEISHRLALDKSTITNIVARLIDQGIVNTLSEGESITGGSGRRPIMLELEHDFGCILGIEMQVNRFSAAIIDIGGKFLASCSEDSDYSPDWWFSDYYAE